MMALCEVEWRSMTDVLILGGGVIGLSIARELARAGASVRLVDRGPLGSEASWAGAGMLPPGNLKNASGAEGQLRGLSHQLWPDLAATLADETGIDIGYRVGGAIHLCDDAATRTFELETWRAEGVRAESLDEQEFDRLEPAVARRERVGLLLPDQAQVRNPRYLKALVCACAEQGVDLVQNAGDVEWLVENEQVRGIRAGSGRYLADRVCVAAGAWSGGLLESLGIGLPIRPVRGQIVLLSMLPRVLTRTVEVGRRYLVPRPDGRVLVGATQEEAGFEKRTTAAGLSELLAFAMELCPALAEATVERSWAGLRPGSADGLPYLGHCDGFENLFVAAGHFRAGLQMSPGTARVMRQLMLGQETDIPPKGFAVARVAPRLTVA